MDKYDKTIENGENGNLESGELESGIEFLNIFRIYYKQLYSKDKSEDIFEDIDYENPESTNKWMELLFEEKLKHEIYEKKDPSKIEIMDVKEIDMETVDELYVLIIEDEYIKMCQSIFPLISYMIGEEWGTINWSINSLK